VRMSQTIDQSPSRSTGHHSLIICHHSLSSLDAPHFSAVAVDRLVTVQASFRRSCVTGRAIRDNRYPKKRRSRKRKGKEKKRKGCGG
jgi:hypothetical protein